METVSNIGAGAPAAQGAMPPPRAWNAEEEKIFHSIGSAEQRSERKDLPSLSPAARRRYGWIRWLTLGGVTLTCLLSSPLRPPLGDWAILAAMLLAYAGLVRYQYGGLGCAEGGPRLGQGWYLGAGALLIFGMMVAPGAATNGQSLWYCVLYFALIGEAGRHLPDGRRLAAVLALCAGLVALAAWLTVAHRDRPQAELGFLPLYAGLVGGAVGARAQRRQEIEHAGRLLLLEELARSKAALEEANHQLQVHAALVEEVAVANERTRLARELHDILGYTLATVVVKAEAARRLLARDLDQAAQELQGVQEVARGGLAEVRRSIGALREVQPAGACGVWHEATARFVAQFGREHGLAVDCAIEPLPPGRAPELEMALFRVIQEALTNVARHARARRVQVTLHAGAEGLELSIVDDGVGLGPQDPPAGFGLRGMRERVELLRGRLVLSSRRGEGTRVQVLLPLPGAGPARPSGPEPCPEEAPAAREHDAGAASPQRGAAEREKGSSFPACSERGRREDLPFDWQRAAAEREKGSSFSPGAR